MPKVNKIIPEKKDIVMIIPAVPGTANPVNFVYKVYSINENEKKIEIIPIIIPKYRGLSEYAVIPLIN